MSIEKTEIEIRKLYDQFNKDEIDAATFGYRVADVIGNEGNHEYDTKNPSQKDFAHVCAGRVVRLIELDAPENILRTELRMLEERIEELFKQNRTAGT